MTHSTHLMTIASHLITLKTLLILLLLALSPGAASAQHQIKPDLPDRTPSLVASPTQVRSEANSTLAEMRLAGDLLDDAPPPPTRPSAALIIKNFIAAETTLRNTLLQFSFKRDVILQTIGPAGDVTGNYLRNSVFILDDRGQRLERVLYHPRPTIKEMQITKEDVQDLAGSQLFGLELHELDFYNFSLVGDAELDGRAVFIVAVNPKQKPDPHRMRARFFVGQIWIDATSFQIVKLQGTTEPHGKQRFPAFKTERKLPVENLLFPSSTSADDVLSFPKRDVHYRIAVKYYDFKRFAARVKIVELDD